MPSSIHLPPGLPCIPAWPPAVPTPADLRGLVRRIAIHDREAFADLYDALSVQLLESVRSSVPDRRRAVAIASAVFVEVWSLARFHANPDTDVVAWLSDIAARRTADRRQVADVNTPAEIADRRPETSRRQLWWAAVADSYDRQADLALAALLVRRVYPGSRSLKSQ